MRSQIDAAIEQAQQQQFVEKEKEKVLQRHIIRCLVPSAISSFQYHPSANAKLRLIIF
jgi:hypothetical protein